MLLGVLRNEAGPARDIVIFNAGVALYAANVAPDIAQGLVLARQVIESGQAMQRLEQLIRTTQSLGA
jgi:anthranilate phosphoribosyltransferase